jgi:hypothetical protein
MRETGALAYWFDIAPTVTSEWLDWYLQDHMPGRVGTVFVSGRCYEALQATASHMVLFETTSPETLFAPSYLGLLSQVSEEDRTRRAWYSNPIRVVCRVGSRCGRGTGGVLGVVRITAAKNSLNEIARCLAENVVPVIAKATGIGAVWVLENDKSLRARIDEVRVTGHLDGSADFALLIEAGHQRNVDSALSLLNEIDAWRSLELGDAVTVGVYRLLYTMNQSDQT